MIIRIRKPITCADSGKCHNDIEAKLLTKFTFEHGKHQNGHIQIQHVQGDHLIHVCLYDKAGKIEMPSPEELKTLETKPDLIEDLPDVTKHSGPKPSKKELEDVL